jgi:hypothetical protein
MILSPPVTLSSSLDPIHRFGIASAVDARHETIPLLESIRLAENAVFSKH